MNVMKYQLILKVQMLTFFPLLLSSDVFFCQKSENTLINVV